MLVDETFYHPRTPVSVVAVGEASEALLVRSLLENLGATVALHQIGTPEDFLGVIGQGPAAQYVVLCGHGDENGFVFGDYADGIGIDISGLRSGSMPAQVIAERVQLRGKVVVSTACETGRAGFGAAFMRGGVAAYIAPDGAPHGADALLFVHLFFHQLLRKRATPTFATQYAKSCDPEPGMFQIFGPP
jgi:hypothetical protein